MKKVIEFNIWNIIDINDVNDILDNTLLDLNIDGVASDIQYNVKNIDKYGNIKINTDFNLDLL